MHGNVSAEFIYWNQNSRIGYRHDVIGD